MLPQAPFGRTGHQSTRVIFGAAALGRMRQERADEVLEKLLRHGVNHIDTAAGYGDSELRVGPWMAEHRSRFFLATKTGERRGDDARAELERSLERLQVDSVDMIQLHNLVEPDEWDVAHGPGGAVEALARARDEGLTRFIGVTGHGTRIAAMHLRSLERFPFDAVLLPYSFVGLQDPGLPGRRRGAARRLRGAAAWRCRPSRPSPGGAGRPTTRAPRYSWYEPLRDEAAIARAVRWVLDHPQLFLNSRATRRCSTPSSTRPRSGGPGADRRRAAGATSTRSPCNRSSTGVSSNASDSHRPGGPRAPPQPRADRACRSARSASAR